MRRRTKYRVVVVTGVPGTGKTSAAGILCRKLNCSFVELSKFVSENKFLEKYDKKRDTWVVDTKKVKRKISDFIRRQGRTVVEGHFAEEVCNPDIVFVLRCRPDVLARRLRKRKYSKDKVNENVLAEILDYSTINSLKRTKKVFEIETTRLTPSRTASIMLEILRGGKHDKRIDYFRFLSGLSISRLAASMWLQ